MSIEREEASTSAGFTVNSVSSSHAGRIDLYREYYLSNTEIRWKSME